MARPRVSVILSIFDQPRAFTFALIGYRRQMFRDFEIVVADDGSDDETRSIVEEFRRGGPPAIKHVWQENRGYRRAKIANEAVKAAEGKIILLSDGDCIPHRNFVVAHAEASGPGRFAVGGYVRLSAEHTGALTLEKVAAGEYEREMSWRDRVRFGWTHFKNWWGLLIDNPVSPRAYGSNISCGRDVYFGVNGYDENFDGFGREDSDLRNRMRRFGAKPVSLWTRAWVYHVDDVIDPKIRGRRVPRRKDPDYYRRLEVPVYCENGLIKRGSTG